MFFFFSYQEYKKVESLRRVQKWLIKPVEGDNWYDRYMKENLRNKGDTEMKTIKWLNVPEELVLEEEGEMKIGVWE